MPAYESVYPPTDPNYWTFVKASSEAGAGFYAGICTDPTKALDGVANTNSWRTGDAYGEWRFHLDLGSGFVIKRIYYENFHNYGYETGTGAKNFTFWGSNDENSFLEMDYAVDDGWTQLTVAQTYFDEHAEGTDASQPGYVLVTNTTEYRYYCVKIVDAWEAENYCGLRRIELQVQTVEVTMPMLTLLAGMDYIAGSLPIPTLSGELLSTTYISASPSIPMLSMFAYTEGWGVTLDEELPSLEASGTGITGTNIITGEDIPMLEISATLLTGTVGEADLTLVMFGIEAKVGMDMVMDAYVPVLAITATSHGPMEADLAETLPMLQVTGYLQNTETGYRVFALNTKGNTLTEYDNFNFNSFCNFKGKTLGANSSGIMSLDDSSDDAGTAINAQFCIGVTDFKLPNIKKIHDAYISVKGDGGLILSVITDDGLESGYPITISSARTKPVKTHVGKGKKGRYWTLALQNIGGADFDLENINLNVELLPRKI